MHQPRVGLDTQQSFNRDASNPADARQIVAYQVHDHDVLGDVLFGEVASGSTGALDWAGPNAVGAPAEEQLGRGGGDMHTAVRQVDNPCIRSDVPLSQQDGQRNEIRAAEEGR
jgi:hypothetical protein